MYTKVHKVQKLMRTTVEMKVSKHFNINKSSLRECIQPGKRSGMQIHQYNENLLVVALILIYNYML